MELSEQFPQGGEFNRARALVCDAAWQFVSDPDVPAWQRVDVALQLAQYAHDQRATDLLVDVFSGESDIVIENPLDDSDKNKLINVLVEAKDPAQVNRAVAIAESIDGSNMYNGTRRGKAFIDIAEHTEGALQERCISQALEAVSTPIDPKDPGRALTDSDRARVFLRAGTLTEDSSLYKKAIEVFTYTEPGSTRTVQIGFGSLGYALAGEITELEETEQSALRDDLVSYAIATLAEQKRPWDSLAGPLMPVLRGEEQVKLLQNFTKSGKFMLDIAVYRAYLDTAKREGWLSRWRQWRDELGLQNLERRSQGIHHLDESNTSWDLFQFGYNDDATLLSALRGITDKTTAELSSSEDRLDVRNRVVTGLTTGLFSPVQRSVALDCLRDLHEASEVDETERFQANLAMMIVRGDRQSLVESTGFMLKSKPWEQSYEFIEGRPDWGRHIDYTLASYLRALNEGEDKELLGCLPVVG